MSGSVIYPGRIIVKANAPLVDLVNGREFKGPAKEWETQAWHRKRYQQYDFWWTLTPDGKQCVRVNKKNVKLLRVDAPIVDSGEAAMPFMHLFPVQLW